MTTANNQTRSRSTVGRRVELARYTTTDARERILYGQRVDGVVRVTDHPASGHGRVVLVERELEQDGNAALQALIADYLDQARVHDHVPMLSTPTDRYLDALAEDHGHPCSADGRSGETRQRQTIGGVAHALGEEGR